MEKGKRGQAFLITTVILIMILVAFVTIANYSKKSKFSTFEDTAKEIQIESEKFMDYALINNDYSEMNSFTKNLSEYVGEDTRIYFITGENPKFLFYNYTGGVQTSYPLVVTNENIEAVLNNANYTFPLTEGKAFYFIMIKEERGERYVYTNA